MKYLLLVAALTCASCTDADLNSVMNPFGTDRTQLEYICAKNWNAANNPVCQKVAQ